MSLRSLKNRSALTQEPDELDLAPSSATPPHERTSEALARCMLEAVLTPSLRQLFKTPARLIVLRTTDEATANLLETHMSAMENAPVVEAITERHKIGGRPEPQGEAELDMLERGRSVILLSPDPERLLVPQALRGADAIISVPDPDADVIRKTIRAVTGGRVRGLLAADIAALSLSDVRVAIRPGLSARECLLNLRRTARLRQHPVEHSPAVPLDRLALTRPVKEWTNRTLLLMEGITQGTTDPSALRFGCLLGPPGTGKTTLAHSLAHAAGWRYLPTSVAEWFAQSDGHLGGVIRAAKQFFAELASAREPIVALIDEIDSLPSRMSMEPRDAQWWSPVVAYCLTEIDALRRSGRPILILGATNHFAKLDPALIRPGRLEWHVKIMPPDLGERAQVFGKYLEDRIEAGGLRTLARLAVLATPAQIESWCVSALANAQGENRPLRLYDLLELIAPRGIRSADKDYAVALHEAGHAVVAFELGLPIAEISILPFGSVGGWVNTEGNDGLFTRPQMERLAVTLLGGRAADTVLGVGAHAGAAADIDSVNTLIRAGMLDMGLYGSLANGLNSDPGNWQNTGLSLAAAINNELNRLYGEAAAIITRRQADVLRLADALVEERVITGEGLQSILAINNSGKDHPVDPHPANLIRRV
jgi:hypothetical protein